MIELLSNQIDFNCAKNFTKLYLDTISKPLLDRGLQGEYPPGSPFKVLTALAALQADVNQNEADSDKAETTLQTNINTLSTTTTAGLALKANIA